MNPPEGAAAAGALAHVAFENVVLQARHDVHIVEALVAVAAHDELALAVVLLGTGGR
jgi:hypothetical protein